MTTGVLAALTSRPGWSWSPLGRVAERRRDSGQPDLEPLSVFLDGGVVPRADRQADNHNRLGESLDPYLVVEPGDLVFNKLRTWQGGFGHSNYRGIVSPAYFVLRPAEAESRYLDYLLHSHPFLQELTRRSKWMPPSQFDIAWEDLRSMPVLNPPPGEQRRIANFLDAQTSRIDALITTKQRMVSLDLERHRALLSSKIRIGPAAEARRVLNLWTSGPRGWADQLTDVGSPFIRSQNLRRDATTLSTDSVAHVDPPVSNEATRSRTELGDVVIGITGANTGWVGIVDERTAGGFVSQHVGLLRPTTAVTSEWLAYAYFSHQGQAQLLGGQYGGTKQQLSLEDLAQLELHVPPVVEQVRMCAEIQQSAARTAQLTATLTRQVGLLKERRQALITAAVSGEISV